MLCCVTISWVVKIGSTILLEVLLKVFTGGTFFSSSISCLPLGLLLVMEGLFLGGVFIDV